MASLSTYTTRDHGSASWAISCVLPGTGMPVPMSRNWRTPRLARWRTTRLRKHRLARTPATIWGRSFMTCSPTVLSAGKWSFPPSQKLQTLAACAVCGSNLAVERTESRGLLRMNAVAPPRFGAGSSLTALPARGVRESCCDHAGDAACRQKVLAGEVPLLISDCEVPLMAAMRVRLEPSVAPGRHILCPF